MQFVSVFFDKTKVADFLWKTQMLAEIKGCVKGFIYFLDFL